MPDQPNYQEFGNAGQKSQKDATEMYDSRYGKWDDKSVRDDKSNKPLPAEKSPIKYSGS